MQTLSPTLLQSFAQQLKTRILDYEVTQFDSTEEIGAERLLVTVTLKEGHQAKFLLKKFKGKELECFKETEQLTYNEEMVSPRTLKDGCLVYQDPFKGGFVVEKSVSLDQVKLVLKKLAKLHARSITYQETTKRCILEDYPEELRKKVLERSYSHFEETWFYQQLEAVLEEEKVAELLNSKPLGETFYRVLCHGNLVSSNVLFNESHEVRFLRSHLQRYCAPAYDVLTYIYSTTTTEQRKQHLQDLLKHYYKSLSATLVASDLELALVLSEDEFQTSVHRLLPQVKLRSACKGTQDASEEVRYHLSNPLVSMEDCFELIKSKGITRFRLLRHELQPLEGLNGFLGDHTKLKVYLSVDDLPKVLHFFVKSPPANGPQAELSEGGKAFFKEVSMLVSFFPLVHHVAGDILDGVVTSCRLARIRDFLVFDDLNLEGYFTTTTRSVFSIQTLEVVVSQLAKLHAASWIVEENLGLRLIDRFGPALEGYFFNDDDQSAAQGVVRTALNHIDHIVDELFDPNQTNLTVEQVKAKSRMAVICCYKLAKPSSKYRNVVCHGDLWASNIMVRKEEGKTVDCRFIDFQATRYCPPSHDLLFLIYMNSNPKTRRESLPYLLELYHKTVSQILNDHNCNVEEIHSYKTFLESCKEMLPQTVCQVITYHQVCSLNSDLMKASLKSEEEWHQVLQVDRREFLSNMYRKDPLYRKLHVEALAELVRVCEDYF